MWQELEDSGRIKTHLNSPQKKPSRNYILYLTNRSNLLKYYHYLLGTAGVSGVLKHLFPSYCLQIILSKLLHVFNPEPTLNPNFV